MKMGKENFYDPNVERLIPEVICPFCKFPLTELHVKSVDGVILLGLQCNCVTFMALQEFVRHWYESGKHQ